MQILALPGIAEIGAGDDLAAAIAQAAVAAGLKLTDTDIVVVSSKVVSKADGLTRPATEREQVINRASVTEIAARTTPSGLTRIVRTRSGAVMTAAGVDSSNVPGGNILLLPEDPDASAAGLRARLQELTGARPAVVLSDTSGRPWREGQADLALGAAGLNPLDDVRGQLDSAGQVLEVTQRAIADQIAAGADLVKGKLTGVPAAILRGLGSAVTPGDGPGVRALLRPASSDWFRYGHVEAVFEAMRTPRQDLVSSALPEPVTHRLIRAVTAALSAPDPLTPASPYDWTCGPAVPGQDPDGQTITLTLAASVRPGNADDHWPSGWTPLTHVGALAQRLVMAAWTQDLELSLTPLAEPTTLLVTARPRAT